ncbi:MAG: uracil-DNA glycosylase [Candidatus Omnitrophota bacterium]|nr:uracil-DNA glycosylase [Candidatus Omnitrophota bacterium]
MSDILKSIRSYLEMEKESGISEYLFTSKPKDARLSLVKNIVSHCQKCPLGKMRKNIVFGSVNINGKLMFVGEAPGHEEDIQGMPFVGEAGALLTKIIEAMAIKRDDVYICNILKCRPPQNRNPLPAEISTCIDYLYSQIDAIKPRVICGLGKFASQALLNTETPISKLRGNWHEYRGMKFMPTYHPAYLLRNPGDKKLVWEDMKKIMNEIKKL